ncbi:MAG: insulinase family protein [Oscillospiraceae bacterium]|jgi:predicted Zn-dependent peptidase|nr:insulinase family protein [Oscillospiraceae bacterium]
MKNSFNLSKIADGVNLCSYRTDRFKTGRISFNIAVPLRAENASAIAILPYILSRSCEKYTDFTALNQELAKLYGAVLTPSISKIGEAQIIRLSMAMIDDRFSFDGENIYKNCAGLLCDLFFSPLISGNAFDSVEVTREKRLLVERIESEKNEKRLYAMRRCEEIMCGSEAYGINSYGTVRGVNELAPESVYNAWKYALEQGVIQINMVGNTDEDEIYKMLKDRFSSVNREKTENISTQVVEKAKEVKKVHETMPINQGKLVMGYRAGLKADDPDYVPAKVAVDLLGGAPYSKLFTNVREKQSLCYYCSAGLFRQKGIMLIQSGIEKENEEKAIKEINNQLQMIKDGDFTSEELAASKAGLGDALMSVSDTPQDIDAWAYSQMTNKSFEHPQVLFEKISHVTEREVAHAAAQITLDTIYMLSGEESK